MANAFSDRETQERDRTNLKYLKAILAEVQGLKELIKKQPKKEVK
jgi:hypothetical protein